MLIQLGPAMFSPSLPLTGQADTRSQPIVPTTTSGLAVGSSYRKMGWRHSDTHEIALDDCRVPEQNLLGERGKGYVNSLQILDDGRIAIAALATGLAQGCSRR